MKRKLLIFNPLFVLIITAVAIILAIGSHINWYLLVQQKLDLIIDRFPLDQNLRDAGTSWTQILIWSFAFFLIIYGLIITFIYYVRIYRLYGLQEQFLNNFTHELKTPLTSLKLYLETFKRHDVDEADREQFLNFMLSDTDRLTKNVNQILHSSKLEKNIAPFKLKECCLNEVIKNLIASHRHMFANSKITWIDHTEQKILLPINEELMETMILNLLSNAIKYNDAQLPEVKVELQIHKNQDISLVFTDNGIGILESEKKKIFKKFYKGQGLVASGKIGTGLGLYLVKQVVEYHKGSIHAHRLVAVPGSQFVVTWKKRRVRHG